MNSLKENKLTHSDDAISVTHEFYNKQYMVYVEGDDDVSFWDAVFSKVAYGKYEIEPLNGISGEIQNYIKKVITGEITNVIVACDNDYIPYLETNPYDNQYIITTYGHSIENTMFCPKNIAVYIRRLSKNTIDYTDTVNNWYDSFCKIADLLLPYEIANFVNTWNGSTEEMTSFFGKNCCRFLSDADFSKLDENKVVDFVNTHKSEYNTDLISNIKNKIKKDNRHHRNIIKGHFITNGVMNLITKMTKAAGHETKVESKQLYATFCDCITPCSELCIEKMQLIEKIRPLFK